MYSITDTRKSPEIKNVNYPSVALESERERERERYNNFSPSANVSIILPRYLWNFANLDISFYVLLFFKGFIKTHQGKSTTCFLLFYYNGVMSVLIFIFCPDVVASYSLTLGHTYWIFPGQFSKPAPALFSSCAYKHVLHKFEVWRESNTMVRRDTWVFLTFLEEKSTKYWQKATKCSINSYFSTIPW